MVRALSGVMEFRVKEKDMKKIALLLLLMTVTGSAVACKCLSPKGPMEDDVKTSFNNASSVVLATAEQVEDIEPLSTGQYMSQRTKFTAVESWKGSHGKEFFTEIVTVCCKCGYHFQAGINYLLYLSGPDQNGNYNTSTCSRTKREVDGIKQELEVLRVLNKNNETRQSSLLPEAESILVDNKLNNTAFCDGAWSINSIFKPMLK